MFPVAVLLSWALAQEVEEEQSVCGLEGPEYGVDPTLEWSTFGGEELRPTLLVSSVDRDDVSYRIDFIVKLGQEKLSWSTEVVTPSAGTTWEVDLEIPAEATYGGGRDTYYSNLRARLIALDPEGNVITGASAPSLVVLFDAQGSLSDVATHEEMAADGQAWVYGASPENSADTSDGDAVIITAVAPPG
jgi:hypothetical protein